MPVLSNDPKKTLTYGEYRKRLLEKFDKNPKDPDPEVQKLKKEYQEVYQGVINNLTPQVEYFNKDVLPDITRTLESPWFTKSLADTINNINSLTEPMKALVEAIAQVKTPILYTQLDILQIHPIINIFPQQPINIEVTSNIEGVLKNEKKILDEEIVPQVQGVNLKTLEKHFIYWPETNSMILIHTEIVALNFGSGTAGDDMPTLVKVFMKALSKKGSIKDGFVEVGLTVSEIIEGLKDFGLVGKTRKWISDTKHNLLDLKLPSIAKGLITISDYNKELDGYYFKIRLNPEIPLLN